MKKKAHQGKLSAAVLLAAFALCMAVLTGCGRNDSEQKRYYMMDIQVQEYPRIEEKKIGWLGIGKQFYKDEIVQFWSESEAGGGEMTVNIYLSHEDGSCELLLKDMPKEYRRGSCRMDESGNLYFLISEELVKLDREGNILFRSSVRAADICQTPDGRIMLLLQGSNGWDSKIAELDAETGAVTEKDITLENFFDRMISDGDGLVLLNSQGIRRLNLNDGSLTWIMNFAALSYKRGGGVYDFRLSEEGRAELLKADAVEILRMEDISETRKIVVLRDWALTSTITDRAYDFNHSNEEYYVVLEEGYGSMDISDFRMQTGIDLAAGRGADIISSDAMPSVMGYIQNGTLEDLTPYIEKSEIRKEDFFPAAFSRWEYDGKIYGVEFNITPTAIWIDEEVLGGREVPDIETLVTAMLDYKGDKKWFWPSDWILSYLLRGSEDMWGLIDWDKGSCDFTGKLFSDMLKAAKMHGGSYDRENASADWAKQSFAAFDSREKLAKEGRVRVGFLFDDGAHPLAGEFGTMAISSSSQNKEGAWAFIRYMLDKDIQNTNLDFYSLSGGYRLPVNRKAFDELGSFLESGAAKDRNYDVSTKQDIIDPKRHEEVRAILEDTRFAPISIGPILSIVLDEADWYFEDVKSLEEVCAIIQNRVKLYLEERR